MSNLKPIEKIIQEFDSGGSSDWIEQEASKLLNSMGNLIVAKYDTVPERLLHGIFSRAAEIASARIPHDRMSLPVAYFCIDKSIMTTDSNSEDRTDFYKTLIGTIFKSFYGTPVSKTEEFQNLERLYEEDFGQIYLSKDETHRRRITNHEKIYPILEDDKNLGYNLAELGSLLGFQALVNISVVPNFPEDSVSIADGTQDSLMIPDDEKARKAVNYSLRLTDEFLRGGDGLRKTVAVPGWTIDLLRFSWDNKPWHDFYFLEGGLLDQIGTMPRINI